jgi:tetratricopeptide (TPR) repeat protein
MDSAARRRIDNVGDPADDAAAGDLHQIPARSGGARVRGTVCIAIVATTLLSTPRPAAAQKSTFVDGLVSLTTALSGRYGDEGPQARAALDTMSRALKEWDDSLRDSEQTVAARLPTATPSKALSMHTEMGAFLLERGRLTDALREFQAASRLAPDNPAFQLFQGVVHDAAGRPADALDAFRHAWDIEREDPVKSYLLATRERQAGAADAARQPMDALSAAAALVVARTYRGKTMTFVRTSLVQDEASSTPLFAPAIYQQAYALIERAAYAEAIAALRATFANDPLLAGALTPRMMQGTAALRDGRILDARTAFAEEIAAQPRSSEAHRLIALTYWATTDYDKSIEHLTESIRLSPADERSRIALARVFTDAGQLERAEQTLVETARALPSSALAHWRLARIYETAHRDQEAAQALEKAAALSALAGRAVLYREIGMVQMRLLDADAAAQAFATRIRLTPNDALAHRERGRALLFNGHEDEGLMEFAAALLLDPSNAEPYLAIGQIHLAAGKYAEALPALDTAVALGGDNAEARYALGTALLRLGRTVEGNTQLEEFRRLQAKAADDRRRQIEIDLLKLEARTRSGEGANDRAVELWQAVVSAQPDVASNHAALAAALAAVGHLDTAADEYMKAIRLDAAPDTYRQLAALYDRMNRPNESTRTRAILLQLQEESLRSDDATR